MKMKTKAKKEVTTEPKVKKETKDIIFFVRNLPKEVANKLKVYADSRRMTLAGAIMELVRHGEKNGFFET